MNRSCWSLLMLCHEPPLSFPKSPWMWPHCPPSPHLLKVRPCWTPSGTCVSVHNLGMLTLGGSEPPFLIIEYDIFTRQGGPFIRSSSSQPTWARICKPFLMRPEIDSQPGGPVRQSYLTYRASRLEGIDSMESIPGLLKRLQIRACAEVEYMSILYSLLVKRIIRICKTKYLLNIQYRCSGP
jgi:hypothetical protein